MASSRAAAGDVNAAGETARIRALGPGDEAALEAYLAPRRDTSMFLRSNARTVGLSWSGQRFQGHWAARLDDEGAIAGVACLFWNGMLIVEDDAPTATTRAAVAAAQRPVAGFIGPAAQVETARSALNLADAAARLDDEEILMALDLERLALPPRLASGEVACRRAQTGDVELLATWRHDYMVEALHEPPGATTAEEARRLIERGVSAGTQWLVEDEGKALATAGINVQLPEIVQIGPVYTPPALRRRGHGQAAVAGLLRDARARGVQRAVLFTDSKNPSSTKAYARVGFASVGAYALVMLAEPARLDAERFASLLTLT